MGLCLVLIIVVVIAVSGLLKSRLSAVCRSEHISQSVEEESRGSAYRTKRYALFGQRESPELEEDVFSNNRREIAGLIDIPTSHCDSTCINWQTESRDFSRILLKRLEVSACLALW